MKKSEPARGQVNLLDDYDDPDCKPEMKYCSECGAKMDGGDCMKRHSDSTLMHMTKTELIEYVRIAEHNQDAAEAYLRQQAENLKDWEPVRHGHWVKRGYVCGETEYECSECHETEWRTSDSRMKWCMFCGAKMDGGGYNG